MRREEVVPSLIVQAGVASRIEKDGNDDDDDLNALDWNQIKKLESSVQFVTNTSGANNNSAVKKSILKVSALDPGQ